MKIGAIVLKLRAKNNAALPQYHGRLLHAAFLTMVRSIDNNFSARMHDAETKNFSIGLLRFAHENLNGYKYIIGANDVAYLRVAGLGDEIVDFILNIVPGTLLRIGSAEFEIAAVYTNQQQSSEAGLTSIESLFKACSVLLAMRRITINFITPAVFKYFNADYPLPKPEFVFGSLAERWNSINAKQQFDIGKIKEIAQVAVVPDNWTGETKRVRHGENRYITAFTGRFTYRIDLLPEDLRGIFITLAEFGVFSGVGRLTGQGFGRITVKYE